jgi:hypothetical protein
MYLLKKLVVVQLLKKNLRLWNPKGYYLGKFKFSAILLLVNMYDVSNVRSTIFMVRVPRRINLVGLLDPKLKVIYSKRRYTLTLHKIPEC